MENFTFIENFLQENNINDGNLVLLINNTINKPTITNQCVHAKQKKAIFGANYQRLCSNFQGINVKDRSEQQSPVLNFHSL